MLHNTLSALLVSVASRYAQLSPSDVGIGIGGGRLVIDDVQLRADTLNNLHIPFHVRHGRAGRLRINIPWGALSSAPVQVYLENVHLIAAPKQQQQTEPTTLTENQTSSTSPSTMSQEPPPLPPLSPSLRTLPRSNARDQPWHQTNVGRLLFNVTVELYGLKIEYRDPHCIGILSIASLRAFSAGPDWSMRFVSFVSDLDRDQPDASAVSMRKIVNLTGVHFVMIPRAKPSTDKPISVDDNSSTGAISNTNNIVFKEKREDEIAIPSDMPMQQNEANLDSLSLPNHSFDLGSFESQNPILDGVSISLRVLFCTGATVLPNTGELTPGLHGEVNVEIDEPSVKLTARQLVWLEHILRQGLGTAPTDDVKRRPPVSLTFADGEDSSSVNRPRVPQESDGYTRLHQRTAHSAPEMRPKHTPRRSGLRSFWEAIVGENSDETVDDAAIALGLLDASDAYRANGRAQGRLGVHIARDGGGNDADNDDDTGNDGDDDDGDDDEEDDRVDSEDQRYARRVVAAAAACGGVSWHVRLRTADASAWDRVRTLEKEVIVAREAIDRADAAVAVQSDALARENEARQQVEEQTCRADLLFRRNQELASELRELERLTSQASLSKDAVIHQLQAALEKAEFNLQAIYQQTGQQLFAGNNSVEASNERTEDKATAMHEEQHEADMRTTSSAGEDKSSEHDDMYNDESKTPETSLGRQLGQQEQDLPVLGLEQTQTERENNSEVQDKDTNEEGDSDIDVDEEEQEDEEANENIDDDGDVVETNERNVMIEANSATMLPKPILRKTHGEQKDEGELQEVQLSDVALDGYALATKEDEQGLGREVEVLGDDDGNLLPETETNRPEERSPKVKKKSAVVMFDEDDNKSLEAFYEAEVGMSGRQTDLRYGKLEEHMGNQGLTLI